MKIFIFVFILWASISVAEEMYILPDEESFAEEKIDHQEDNHDKNLNKDELTIELEQGIENRPSFTGQVILQGLNKITARSTILKIEIGRSINFGNLEISAKQCWKSSIDEQPDNKVLLEIIEHRPDEQNERIFYGWMFSSSPAISALEHPVYDLIVINCNKNK
jgi:hypothetical protein